MNSNLSRWYSYWLFDLHQFMTWLRSFLLDWCLFVFQPYLCLHCRDVRKKSGSPNFHYQVSHLICHLSLSLLGFSLSFQPASELLHQSLMLTWGRWWGSSSSKQCSQCQTPCRFSLNPCDTFYITYFYIISLHFYTSNRL